VLEFLPEIVEVESADSSNIGVLISIKRICGERPITQRTFCIHDQSIERRIKALEESQRTGAHKLIIRTKGIDLRVIDTVLSEAIDRSIRRKFRIVPLPTYIALSKQTSSIERLVRSNRSKGKWTTRDYRGTFLAIEVKYDGSPSDLRGLRQSGRRERKQGCEMEGCHSAGYSTEIEIQNLDTDATTCAMIDYDYSRTKNTI
jgi:hypothetical protein